MKSNETLQRNVQESIKWEPMLHAAEIGVTVKDGIVTLSGVVDSYAKKTEAENAAKNVIGVKAIVEKIEIKFRFSTKHDDNEIAREVLIALSRNWSVPQDNIKVKVEEGWVTLEGEIQWNFQKEAAEKSIGNIVGVKGITNNISIKLMPTHKVEKETIERALVRNWALDNREIKVDVVGNRVRLTGSVHSLYQKFEAGRIVWNAPGVSMVINDLTIE